MEEEMNEVGKRERVEHELITRTVTTIDAKVKLVLTACYSVCAKCNKPFPVQLRLMDTGEYRNQPQCSQCR
jgi:hypothetical protein